MHVFHLTCSAIYCSKFVFWCEVSCGCRVLLSGLKEIDGSLPLVSCRNYFLPSKPCCITALKEITNHGRLSIDAPCPALLSWVFPDCAGSRLWCGILLVGSEIHLYSHKSALHVSQDFALKLLLQQSQWERHKTRNLWASSQNAELMLCRIEMIKSGDYCLSSGHMTWIGFNKKERIFQRNIYSFMTTGQTTSVEKFRLDVVLQPLFSRSQINFELQKVPFILEKVQIQNNIQWTSTRCQCLMLTGSWNGWPRTRIQSRPGSSTTTLSFLHAVHRCQGGSV